MEIPSPFVTLNSLQQIAMLIVGRLINGFGAGQLTAVFPIYASEVAPPSIRGAFGGFQMVREPHCCCILCLL